MKAFNKWKFRETLPDDAYKKVSERLIGYCYEVNVGCFVKVFCFCVLTG